MGIRTVRDVNNIPKLEKIIKSLRSKTLKVGILSGTEGEILMIATVHEFGYPELNIPERSFIRAYFEKNESKIYKEGEALLEQVILNLANPDVFWNSLGEYLVGEVQEYIRSMKSPGLKPQTIERKGSSGLLVDTGRLLGSIDYEIV